MPVHIDQVKWIAATYQGTLKAFLSKRYTLKGQLPDNESALAHIKWMCQEIASMEDTGKAVRWLCFVQGVLWMTGRRTIDEMRNDNRSPG